MAKELQFAVAYIPTEDRLRINGLFPDGSEVKVLLTRRLVRNLLGSVGQVAEKMVPAEKVATPQAKKAVASFNREAAVQKADFSKKYAGGGAPHPELGDDAQLVTEVQMAPLTSGKIRFRLVLASKKYVETALPEQTFWGLIHLIEKQAAKAQWGLPPRAAAPAEKKRSPAEPKPEKPRLN